MVSGESYFIDVLHERPAMVLVVTAEHPGDKIGGTASLAVCGSCCTAKKSTQDEVTISISYGIVKLVLLNTLFNVLCTYGLLEAPGCHPVTSNLTQT